VRLLRRGEAASTLDLLVAGLGNPGREYERTRHNAGWLVADELARRHGGSFRSKFSGRLAELRVDDLRLALLKPETYMNESGRAVQAAAAFYKLEPDASAPSDSHCRSRPPVVAFVAESFVFDSIVTVFESSLAPVKIPGASVSENFCCAEFPPCGAVIPTLSRCI
jgi:hypothetical protein